MTNRMIKACISRHLEILSVKRQGSADQCIEDDSQAPDIHLRTIILFALEEFWGSIRRTATESIELVPKGEFVAKAKVCNLDVHISIQEQVFCLERRWQASERTKQRRQGPAKAPAQAGQRGMGGPLQSQLYFHAFSTSRAGSVSRQAGTELRSVGLGVMGTA